MALKRFIKKNKVETPIAPENVEEVPQPYNESAGSNMTTFHDPQSGAGTDQFTHAAVTEHLTFQEAAQRHGLEEAKIFKDLSKELDRKSIILNAEIEDLHKDSYTLKE